MQARCTDCDKQRFIPHSCGHRACPHCQHHESQQWLQRQTAKLVPGDYFLLTFTLPAELHTHSRRLDYHPHVHLVMPAAAVDAKARLWRTKTGRNAPWLFSHKALAKVFRAKMLDAISQAGLALSASHPEKWVVDCKHVGAGEKALVYLGRYLYRCVIREKDILACKNGQVTYRYQDSKTRLMQTRTLPGADFLRLLLRHVLPKGLRRARNFGFLHPNSKRLIQLLQLLFKINPGQSAAPIRIRPAITCPCCGGVMKIVRTRILPLSPGDCRPTDVATGVMAM